MATSSVEQAPILVVAALNRELSGLTGSTSMALLETGEGIANAERRLQSWLERRRARAVVSIGFAGALSPSLEPGDLVIAREVRDAEGTPDLELISTAAEVRMEGPHQLFGTAFTANEILWRAESKRELACSLAAGEIGFVDMESTAIASVCAGRGVPFLIARSITDLLDEDLPLDFNRYRNGDGRIDSKRVVKAALVRPRAFAGLLELRKRSRICSARLAEFVHGLALRID